MTSNFFDHNSRINDNAEGLALANALAGQSLGEYENFALTLNYGFFESNSAIAAGFGYRINKNITIDGGIGYGLQR